MHVPREFVGTQFPEHTVIERLICHRGLVRPLQRQLHIRDQLAQRDPVAVAVIGHADRILHLGRPVAGHDLRVDIDLALPLGRERHIGFSDRVLHIVRLRNIVLAAGILDLPARKSTAIPRRNRQRDRLALEIISVLGHISGLCPLRVGVKAGLVRRDRTVQMVGRAPAVIGIRTIGKHRSLIAVVRTAQTFEVIPRDHTQRDTRVDRIAGQFFAFRLVRHCLKLSHAFRIGVSTLQHQFSI